MSDEENRSVLVSDRQQSALKKKKKKTLQILSVNLISIQLDVGI